MFNFVITFIYHSGKDGTVTITGDKFTSDSIVKIGGVVTSCDSTNAPNQLECNLGQAAAGKYEVIVDVPGKGLALPPAAGPVEFTLTKLEIDSVSSICYTSGQKVFNLK